MQPMEKNYPNAIYEGGTGATSAVLDISGCNKLVIEIKKEVGVTVHLWLYTSLTDSNHGYFDTFDTSGSTSMANETGMIDCSAETLFVKIQDITPGKKATISVKAIGD